MCDLIPDIWLLIVEYLNSTNLYTLSEAFSNSRACTFFTGICAKQAHINLKRLIGQGAAEIMIQIRGNGLEVFSNRPMEFAVPFYSGFQQLKVNFISNCIAEVTMKLSAGQRLRCFDPTINSAEPVQIFHAVIRYSSKETVGHIDHERVDLEYRVVGEKDSESAIRDFFPENGL